MGKGWSGEGERKGKRLEGRERARERDSGGILVDSPLQKLRPPSTQSTRVVWAPNDIDSGRCIVFFMSENCFS